MQDAYKNTNESTTGVPFENTSESTNENTHKRTSEVSMNDTHKDTYKHTNEDTLETTNKDTSKSTEKDANKTPSQILKEMREKRRLQNQRYRQKKAATGQKLLQFWVPEEVAELAKGRHVFQILLCEASDPMPLKVGYLKPGSDKWVTIWPKKA